MRVIFAGGGTAGHINPALAVANELKKLDEITEILYVGTEHGMESRLVPSAGIEIKYIDVLGFKRRFTYKNLKVLFKAFKAMGQSKRIIKDFRPDVVIGTGGYVSGPVLYTAARRGIPTLIHEQNVFAGFSSKLLKRFVDVVAISFRESEKYFKGAKKVVHTGNPLRGELFEITKEEARRRLGLDGRPFILAFGGSLGAEKFNQAVLDFINAAAPTEKYQIMLSTGEMFYDECKAALKATTDSVRLVKYIHNMQEVMGAADLVVARAGAITVSELTALGKPSILIPSPNVTNNHQEYNARALEKRGAAQVLLESEFSENALGKMIESLVDDKEALQKMAQNSEKMGIKDATQKIVEEINRIIC